MRINSAIKVLYLLAGLSAAACTNNKTQPNMTNENEVHLFPKGDKLPASYFTGDAFLTPLLAKDANNDFLMGSVTFEPGARTIWHTHPRGQVLVVTEGRGWYQVKGKPAQVIQKGDVINIPENTEHWHGASDKSKMVHIAITNYKDDVNVVWLKPVTDEEYATVNKQ
jgi:quercetin dioxygenase-like cupin family protein